MTTIPMSDQEARDRAEAAADLHTWEELDEKYDAKRAGEFERRLDELFSGGAR